MSGSFIIIRPVSPHIKMFVTSYYLLVPHVKALFSGLWMRQFNQQAIFQNHLCSAKHTVSSSQFMRDLLNHWTMPEKTLCCHYCCYCCFRYVLWFVLCALTVFWDTTHLSGLPGTCRRKRHLLALWIWSSLMRISLCRARHQSWATVVLRFCETNNLHC